MDTEAIAAFDLLSRMRFACGDNGKRMQDELEEYLRGLKRDAERYRWLRDHWHNLCTATGIDTHGNYCVTEIFVGLGEHAPFADGTLEAAIDAAMRG